MKTQLMQLSLLESQEITGGTSTGGLLCPVTDPEHPFKWPGNISIVNPLPHEYITLAIHENGGKTTFMF